MIKNQRERERQFRDYAERGRHELAGLLVEADAHEENQQARLGALRATAVGLRDALSALADASEALASSDVDMPSYRQTCEEYDRALAAARDVLFAAEESL